MSGDGYCSVIKQYRNDAIDENGARLVEFVKDLVDNRDYYERCANCLLTRKDTRNIIELLATE